LRESWSDSIVGRDSLRFLPCYKGFLRVPEQARKGQFVNKTILVVEDSDDSREMLVELLKYEGFDVLTAEDGQIGLSRALTDHPDLVVTDLSMPKLDGIELINRIRAEAGCDPVPIVAMSAYGDVMLRWALRAGATCAIAKPLDFEPFIETIRILLGDAPGRLRSALAE
jgi:CheY-like chemotaxis protein